MVMGGRGDVSRYNNDDHIFSGNSTVVGTYLLCNGVTQLGQCGLHPLLYSKWQVDEKISIDLSSWPKKIFLS